MTLPCVVLAGGMGTRMRPLTDAIPKALVQVAGRPFIDFQLEWLAASGVTDVVLSIGYRGAQLRAHVGDGVTQGVVVRYVDEGEQRLGTGGAVRRVVDHVDLGDAFFLMYGDSYLDVDLSAVERAWRRSNKPGLMTVIRNAGRWGPSNAIYHRSLVTLYDKGRPDPTMRWIDYGVIVLTPTAVRSMLKPDRVSDLAEPLHDMSMRRELAGFAVTRRFFEIGSPSGVRDLERHLARQGGARFETQKAGTD